MARAARLLTIELIPHAGKLTLIGIGVDRRSGSGLPNGNTIVIVKGVGLREPLTIWVLFCGCTDGAGSRGVELYGLRMSGAVFVPPLRVSSPKRGTRLRTRRLQSRSPFTIR